MTIAPELRALYEQAEAARAHAYAPYSGLKVGAAVRLLDGRVITGANVEEASYTLSICAERVAAFAAYAQGERDLAAVAVAGGPSVAPCGACRQVLNELCAPGMPIVFMWRGELICRPLAQLLPHAFDAAALP